MHDWKKNVGFGMVSWLASAMVLVSLLLLPVGRSQALEVSIETSNPEVAEQSQFEIAIYADDASDLISMGVAVTFDPDILRVITATKNQDPTTGFIMDPDGDPDTTADQISDPAVEIDNTAGTVTMIGGRMMGSTTTGLSGKVLLGSITFEGLQIGSSNIHVDLANYHPEHPTKTFANFVTITGTVDEPTNLGDLAAIAILSDQDLDGLPDSHETGTYGTDPSLADTDGDGIDDGEELTAWDALDCSGLGCGDCWDCDIDNDGQANNLLDADADGDGFLDGEELLAGYDPADHPAATAVPALNTFGILMAIILLMGVAVMSEKKGLLRNTPARIFFLELVAFLVVMTSAGSGYGAGPVYYYETYDEAQAAITAFINYYSGYSQVAGDNIYGTCPASNPDDYQGKYIKLSRFYPAASVERTFIWGCGACVDPQTVPYDADGDRTPDCNDNCPDDATKTEPGICGCGVAENTDDTDADGVIDCLDSCPAIKGNSPDGCRHLYLDQGRDPKAPMLACAIVSEKGNPTSIYTGNKIESEKDLRFNSPFAGGLTFTRFYNSQSEASSPMGYGWTHGFNFRLLTESDYLVVVDETGFGRYFSEDSSTGDITTVFGERTELSSATGDYVWQREDGRTYTFDASTYQLLHIEDTNGNRQTLTYDATDPSLLDSVLDEASGRILEFSYTNGLLTTIHLYSGTVDGGVQVTYGHDADGNLTTVTFSDGSGFVYTYDDANNDPDTVPFINNLTRKTDAAGHLLATWAYDAQDRCFENVTGDGRGVTLDYDTIADAVVVTDAYGSSKTYALTTIGIRKRIASVTGESGCSTCVSEPIRWEYDANLNVTEIEYANGRIDQFSNFDSRGNAGTKIQAAGTADARTITTTWHPTLNLPLTRTEASVLGTSNKVTTWDYDDDGNTTANENPTTLVHRVVINGFTQNASGSVVTESSTSTFTHDAKGQLLSIDGPLAGTADTTAFGYDATTGDLLTLTLPVSGTTTFSSYDAAGRPGQVTDANLNSMAYTYDGRGRLSSLTQLWDNAVTSYTYTLSGKPDTVSLPNGMTLTYTYESVYGRLTGITDALGNKIGYGYDDQGNVTETGYYLPTEVQTYLERFNYQYPSRPGKLWKRISPDDTFYQFGYDAMGQLNQVTDPEGKITTYGHDLFNRKSSIVQPGSLTTALNYDTHGNLVLVTDPESQTTEYVVDDLGRTVKTVSPDSGTTFYTYDAAGNLVSKTDARGITVTYIYDAENRLTGIDYPGSAEDVTYTYDQGTNGIGHLTGVTDESGSYVYSWNADGNLVSEQKTVDGVAYTTGYTYDEIGLLNQMTYPDGRIVTFQRDDAGNVTQVTAGSTILVSNGTYLPFGPLQSMTLGNDISVNRSFDLLYWQTDDAETGIQNLNYDFDLVGNVSSITDNLDISRNLSFGYDNLYRLTDAIGIYGTINFTMDDVGNRLTRTIGGLTETLAYTTGTNRLDSITGTGTVDIATDANGNITTYGTRTLTYNQANRLSEMTENGTVLGAYVYSADGRRIKKTVNGTVTVYHYDTSGHLIGESNDSGNFTRLYVYLNGQPLSLITVDATTENVYYYHVDHLGTPQKLTDTAGLVVWSADYQPFGSVDITIDDVENNLRFAGQYFDAETGLHYNYHRYYDPSTGRYLTPDPIGLDGGINLFAYVQNNPVSLTDPLGLWSFSVSWYWNPVMQVVPVGIGGTLTIGYKNGVGFANLSDVGLGAGAGAALDFSGGPPEQLDISCDDDPRTRVTYGFSASASVSGGLGIFGGYATAGWATGGMTDWYDGDGLHDGTYGGAFDNPTSGRGLGLILGGKATAGAGATIGISHYFK